MTPTLSDRPCRTRHRSAPRVGAVLVAVLVAAVLASLLTACSDAHTTEDKQEAESGTDPRVLTVFQPPELVPAMKALAAEFGRDHPGVGFVFDTETSSAQRKQIEAGAKPSLWIDDASVIDPYADDPRSRGELFDVGSNVLQFVVGAGNPKGITELAVFDEGGGPYPTARTGLCRRDVRCGSVAGKLLVSQDVDATPTTRFGDGELLVDALVAGEIDAGIVFRTDASPRGTLLTLVPLENPRAGLVDYHMLRFTSSTTAAEFEAFLGTERAKAILTAQGLLPKVEDEPS
jgi:molybdate transport system substrate-binding protein